jgi:hypothetical protein
MSLRFRFSSSLGGKDGFVASLQVRPRPTPGEHDGVVMDVDVDEDLAVLAATLEDWVTPRPGWELMLRQGTEFDRRNNVEGEPELALGEQTSRLLFRLDQLEAADDTPEELVLRFEERDGIATLARLNENGLDVELFHILTFT